MLLAILVVPGAGTQAQQSAIDRDLDEAKALYREAKFPAAIAKLQSVVGRLEHLSVAQARQALGEAHLHLALSYLALNDPLTAKESLKALVRTDPVRVLDPEVYAPKVIELFNEARAQVAKEPSAAAADASQPGKKGGSRKFPILVGAGVLAAGAVALAVRGGSASGSPAMGNTPAATPTPTPTPLPSGSGDIMLVGAVPAPGSTISLSSNPRFQLSFVYTLPGTASRCMTAGMTGSNVFDPSGPGYYCGPAGNFIVAPGTNVTRTLEVSPGRFGLPGCELPLETTVVQAAITAQEGCVFHCGVSPSNCVAERFFELRYRFVP